MTGNKRHLSCLIWLLATSTSLTAVPALAQLDEIVITAERRESTIIDTPISITAFDAKKLETFRVERSIDIANQTPNLNITEVFGLTSPAITIRGISNADYSATSNSPVTVYSDGVVLNNTTVHGIATFDLERVEVLRGPQGTLYGRNSTSGSVNFISARPTEEFSGYGRFTAGNFGQLRFEGAISGPLGDRAGARLAVVRGVADGWVKVVENGQETPEQDDLAVRGVFELSPTDNFDIFLKAQYSKYDGEMILFHSQANVNPVFGTPNPGPANGFRRISLDFRDRPEEVTSTDIALQLDWDLGGVVLTSVSGFNDHTRTEFNDDDASAFVGLHDYLTHDSTQYSQELRATSDTDSAFSWIAGLYYMFESVDAETRFDFTDTFFDPDPLNGYGSGRDGDQDLTSYAAFVQTDYDINDRWSGGFGIRWTRDKKEIDYAGNSCIEFPRTSDIAFIDWSAITGDCFGLGNSGTLQDEESWTALSGKFSVEFRPTDASSIYASVSRGFKGGGFNLNTSNIDTVSIVDPEGLWAYEIGGKWAINDREAILSGAFFYYDYTDYQQFSLTDLADPGDPPNLANVLSNIEEARLFGLEVEATWAPTENWLLNVGLGYVNSEYTDFVQDDGTNLNGNRFTESPAINFNGLIQYTFFIGGSWSIAPQFDWTYNSSYFTDLANTRSVTLPDGQVINLETEANWDFNLRLRIEGENGLSLTAFVEDIGELDGDILKHAESFSSFGTDFTNIARPMTFGVTLGYEF